MKINITIPQGVIRNSFITPKALGKLQELGEVVCNPSTEHLTPRKLADSLADTDVLITGWGNIVLDEAVLQGAPKLKIIAHTGGSVGNLVEPCVYEKGIRVLSGNRIYAKSVAEGCICYMLSSLRQIETYVNLVRTGSWREEAFDNRGLLSKRVGLVGFGEIAKHLANMLHLFDAQVFVNSSYLTQKEAEVYGVRIAELGEIFETCDVVSLHSALTSKTKGMIGEVLLSRLKPGALLVNTARGEIIDEEALVRQLRTGRFSAVLDVYTREPLPVNSPFRTMKNVLPIPHMGGPTNDMREQVVLSLADDIKRYFNSEPLLNEVSSIHASRMTKV